MRPPTKAALMRAQPPSNALPQTLVSELLDNQHGDKLAGQPFSMLVASGPYSLDDDLSYAPLEALVDIVHEERPDVLILVCGDLCAGVDLTRYSSAHLWTPCTQCWSTVRSISHQTTSGEIRSALDCNGSSTIPLAVILFSFQAFVT